MDFVLDCESGQHPVTGSRMLLDLSFTLTATGLLHCASGEKKNHMLICKGTILKAPLVFVNIMVVIFV